MFLKNKHLFLKQTPVMKNKLVSKNKLQFNEVNYCFGNKLLL